MIIFLDMDGVLCDFDGAVAKQCGSKEKWADDWSKLPSNFFEVLPKLPDADLLVDYVRGLFDIHILTAIPKRGQYDGARVQKYKWCLDHLKIYPSKIHVCFWEEKQYYAAEENLSPNLLIDDSERNCTQFKAKGGIAILHTSAENSIRELQQLGF